MQDDVSLPVPSRRGPCRLLIVQGCTAGGCEQVRRYLLCFSVVDGTPVMMYRQPLYEYWGIGSAPGEGGRKRGGGRTEEKGASGKGWEAGE